MVQRDVCKRDCIAAFMEGTGGKPVTASAQQWLEQFCDQWLESKGIPAIWDREHQGQQNGKMFQGRFHKIGQYAAKKCEQQGGTQIDAREVDSATQEVVSLSACPYCP